MIPLPSKPKIIKKENNKVVLEIEGCYPGYGVTLGTTLRRVLLSSIEGVAITGVKIKGIPHEFSTIPNVLEDVIGIILKLKQIRFRLLNDTPGVKGFLKVKGEKEVKAKDIKIPSDVEIVNKDAHIATLTDKKAELEMELDIEKGLGYSPVERRKKEKLEIGKIAIDAIFTPVVRVTYQVENMRVGDRTDFNRLKMEVETDGSIEPERAFREACDILAEHFGLLSRFEEKEAVRKKTKKEVKKVIKKKNKKEEAPSEIKIEDLKLPKRIINSLSKAGMKTVAGLIRKKEEDLMKLEGMGEKGVKEVKRALGKLGFTLKE